MANAEIDIQCTCCSGTNTLLHAIARDIEYFSSKKEYSYFHCHDCGLLFICPQPVTELKQIYPERYYAYNEGSKTIANRIKSFIDKRYFRSRLKHIKAEQLHVLDIGGGTGTLCDVIRMADKRVIRTCIVDIDPNAAKTALGKGHEYFCGQIEDFVSAEKYEVILMYNILEHVASPASLLKKASSMLARDGIIILQTPNFKSLDADLFRHDSWGGYHCPRHWVIFSKDSLVKLASGAGLKLHAFSYTQGAAFWTVNLLHLLQRLKLIRADAQRPLVYHPLFGPISILAAAFDFFRKPFNRLSQMLVVLKHD